MPDVEVTREKIRALLEELRSWTPGDLRHTLHELARTFDLDVFIVDRIAKSEGFILAPGIALEDDVDPNAITQEIEAESVPDPDED